MFFFYVFFAAHIPANDPREGATQVFCGLGESFAKVFLLRLAIFCGKMNFGQSPCFFSECLNLFLAKKCNSTCLLRQISKRAVDTGFWALQKNVAIWCVS